MSSCGSCGVSVPDGQKFCSMCYGDPEYGRDGYYKRMLEEDMRRQDEERQWEQEMENERDTETDR